MKRVKLKDCRYYSYAFYSKVKYQLMSVKSLLQLILFFLILIIVGGIYFLYFYQGQNKITLSNNIELEKLDTNFKSEEELFNENLLEDNSRKKERSKESKNINEDNSIDNKQIKNLTKDIEYNYK